jgi:PAS domain S-box-containing protein
VRLVLEDADLDVVEAGSAEVALELCAQHELAVVVLDIGLGGMSGFELVPILRERHPGVPVVMLTGATDEDDRIRALDSGAHDYITKPFSNRELVARVLAASRSSAVAVKGAHHRLLWSGGNVAKVPTVVVAGDIVAQVNDAALELLGARDESQVLGRSYLDFVAAESVAASLSRKQRVIEGDWPRPEAINVLRVDGRPVEVEVASVPVLFDGEPASQITLWEPTPQPVDLQAVAIGVQSEVPDAVIVTDLDLVVRSFNPAAEELYGWREQEAVGRHIFELLQWDFDSAIGREADEAFRTTGRWHGELTERRKDGELVRVRSSATILHDRAHRPLGVVTVNRQVRDHPRVRAAQLHEAELDVRRGLDAGEFTVHYQPVVNLESGEWTGVEALVRWDHETRGLLPPGAFIDAAERSGDIVELGHFVLEEACRQWRRWHTDGVNLKVAVNLSGRQLADADLVRRVAEVTKAASMPAGELWLEVTETSLVQDLDQAADVLRRLNEQGARVSIDDFGTGWASLTYLRRFPVDALKIDRTFVEGLGTGGNDEAIVSSIISLGAELHLDVVAEGIETVEQASRLRALNCALGQGYHFARPASASDLRRRCRG